MKNLIIILSFAALTQAFEQCKENYEQNVDGHNICGSLPSSCNNSRYRSYDGSCNNLLHPQWGSSNSAYARFVKNSYSDGVHELPRSCTNEPLMNPRDISLKVSPDVIVKDDIWTVITIQWGQIVAHDMSFTADVPQTGVDDIVCCTNGEPLPPKSEYPDPRCEPIAIPKDDPFNAPEGNTCINFVRTSSNKDKKCYVPGKVIEPLSAVTAYHDLSIVYGNCDMQAKKVRLFKGGKLAFVVRNGQTWLPQDSNVTFACNNVKNAKEPCYFAGDVRVNQNPQLALTQNVLMREHNRIAGKLCGIINPQWDDERCFQETRRILIGMAQHITYKEFLPIILGKENAKEKGITYPNADGFVNDYNPHVNAQTLNEHATAAYRAFHTLIVGFLKLFSDKRQFIGELRLSDWFGRPITVEENTIGLTTGLTTQLQNAADRFYDSEINQYFFRATKDKLGQDMHAIDIQRSRDHGVGTYASTLDECGFGRPKSFDDLKKFIKPEYVELLEEVYQCVENVELAVAGLLETKVNGTLAGPTFLCILSEQFYRTRVGDRFFYENGQAGNAFTPSQLKSIKKATMSRLLCDNVQGIHQMQPYAFEKLSDRNKLKPCNTLPQVDLWLWKEGPGKSNTNNY